ncbi:MAG: site-specific integrase [Peptostreptococcus sp.]|uniref:site-specific integrase n=1 Tax=Peptostreptococcus sp. TaxID=1262 RepID=UPI002FC86A0C
MTQYKDTTTNTWYCKFRYKDYKGESKQKFKRGFKTKREAKEWEINYLNENIKNMYVLDAIEEYFAYISTRLRENTIQNKKWYAKNLSLLHGLTINQVTPKIILFWQEDLSKNGKANKTINQSTNILYSVFNHNNKIYNTIYNPVKTISKLPTETKEKQVWTKEYFDKFLDYVTDPEKIIAYKILFYTGIRYGELLGLTIEDIYDTYIDINKAYNYRQKRMDKTKNQQSVRKVLIPSWLYKEIMSYIDTLYKPNKKMQLFSHPTNTWLQTNLMKICKDNNLKHIRVHDLRHSHATMLINNGIDIMIVSKRLGHKNISTTINTYAHLYETRHQEVIDFLEKL